MIQVGVRNCQEQTIEEAPTPTKTKVVPSPKSYCKYIVYINISWFHMLVYMDITRHSKTCESQARSFCSLCEPLSAPTDVTGASPRHWHIASFGVAWSLSTLQHPFLACWHKSMHSLPDLERANCLIAEPARYSTNISIHDQRKASYQEKFPGQTQYDRCCHTMHNHTEVVNLGNHRWEPHSPRRIPGQPWTWVWAHVIPIKAFWSKTL